MIFFHTKFRMLLDWTASRIQFHQTSLTNVAKFLLLQVFLNIRHKLFEFQTFMNQTQIIILQTLLYTLQTHIIYIIYFQRLFLHIPGNHFISNKQKQK